MVDRFKIPTRPKSAIEFELESPDGTVEKFSFEAPKRAMLVASLSGSIGSQVETMMKWLDSGLSEKGAARLEERLKDPDDDLDIDTVTEIFKRLVESTTARPT